MAEADPSGGRPETVLTPVDRPSVVELTASALREGILEGNYRPDEKLPEQKISEQLNVSRNTLREAFRLLDHERLVVHKPGRGVHVRELTVDDLRDVYRLRRLVECAAIRELHTTPPDILAQLAAAVEQGRTAAHAGDWKAVGTANLHFHRAITSTYGSPRLNQLMERVLAELRLAFAVMKDARQLHEPYLELNNEIYHLLVEGNSDKAELALDNYLHHAERRLTEAFAAQSPASQSGRPHSE